MNVDLNVFVSRISLRSSDEFRKIGEEKCFIDYRIYVYFVKLIADQVIFKKMIKEKTT